MDDSSTRPDLRLAVGAGPKRKIKQRRTSELPQGLLALMQSRIQSTLSTPEEVENLFWRLSRVKDRNVLVQLSQHVLIELLNDQGDVRVRFQFDVANFGLRAYTHRAHRFWFDRPQEDVTFRCLDPNYQTELPLVLTNATPNCRELQITFPSPLEPADRQRYEIAFEARGMFTHDDSDCAYNLSPRTITNLLSFTVVASEKQSFARAYVTHESADGFFRDDPPLLVVSNDRGRQSFSWQIRMPNPGDIFRTFWS